MAHKPYSNSELQSYKACPLQWRFYWDLKLRAIEAESGEHHLRFGNAFHKGLEQLYRGGSFAAAKEAFLTAYPRQLDANDRAKTRDTGVVALAEYVKRWKDEDRQWRVLEIEERSDVPWSVRPDIVLQNIEHGDIYMMDNKTTGQYLNYRYWERFQPNSQITHFLDYGQSKYGEIEGFIVNAIGFRYRERRYKDEPAGFWAAFERQTFNRKREQLQFERESRAAWIEDVERSRAANFYRTNTDACWRCQFKPICAAGWEWESDRELIELQFQQVCDARWGTDGSRCVLRVGHSGECSTEPLPVEGVEFEIEV